MIAVDTSALMAILLDEPDADRYAAALIDSDRALVAAPTLFELRLVVVRTRGPRLLKSADALLAQHPIEVVAWERSHIDVATTALMQFGGRPARLNFGDCMAYALAKSLDVPLLYKGEDFARTDIRSALD